MLLEIEEDIAQNTPTFFDYEVKIDKLSQDNLALKMRLKEMENEMLKAKIETMEIQLKANSDYFERKQAEFDAMIECLEDLKSKYTEVMSSSRRLDSELNKLSNIERDIARIKKIDKNRHIFKLMSSNYTYFEPDLNVNMIRVSFPEPFNSHINKLIKVYNETIIDNDKPGYPRFVRLSQFPIEKKTYDEIAKEIICLLVVKTNAHSNPHIIPDRNFQHVGFHNMTSDYKRVLDFLDVDIKDINEKGFEFIVGKLYTPLKKYMEIINTF
jgi:hypothetical protein